MLRRGNSNPTLPSRIIFGSETASEESSTQVMPRNMKQSWNFAGVSSMFEQ